MLLRVLTRPGRSGQTCLILTSLALAKHDKNVLQNVGVSPPKSGWALSDRLDWALALQVSPPARFVAVAIVRHTGAETGLAWPSLATLAGLTGYSKATVKRAVRELEKGAHFDITRLKIGRKNTSNRYRVPVKGWGQSDPRGGVRVTPEPVSTEPVHTQRARVSCETHGRDLVRVGRQRTALSVRKTRLAVGAKRPPKKPRGGMPTYTDRPPRASPPMTDQQTADAEDLAVANGWRRVVRLMAKAVVTA